MPVVTENQQTIAFLDTEIITTTSGIVHVSVYRKSSHTNKYLLYKSHSHVNDKKAVVKTLLDRSKTIPTNSALQAQETKNVIETLKLNGYQKHFIEKVVANNHQTNTNAENEIRGSTCLPFVNGVSEKVKSILTNAGVRVAFKPILTLGNIFRKPKARPSEDRTKAIVYNYKYKCRECHLHISVNQRDVGRQGG